EVASIGAGLNWGGGKSLSGSINASVGPFSAFVDSNGNNDVSVGVGASTQMFGKLSKALGPVSGNLKLSYSLNNQWNLTGSVGYETKNNINIGMNMSTSGSMGVGMSGENKSGDFASGGTGMNASSFSSGDANVDQQSMGITIPLQIIGIPLSLGFRKTKVKINIRKGFNNLEWGALYASSYNYNDNTALIYNVDNNHNPLFNDYATRTKSIDAYSTRLPQSEEDFIGDYS